MAIRWYDAAVNAVAALCNSGTIKVYTASQPAEDGSETNTLLGTLTLASTAFGSSSGGTAAAGSITGGTAVATGSAAHFDLCKSDGTIVGTGTVGMSGSGADLILNTTAIVSGAPVSCSSFSLAGS